MKTDERSRRLAVLIDADNASAKIVDDPFEEISRSAKRACVRFTATFLMPARRAGTTCCQDMRSSLINSSPTRRERTRQTLHLLLMPWDLLHSGRFDALCLVSSDSNFTLLAARIREQGATCMVSASKRRPKVFGRHAGDLSIRKIWLLPPQRGVRKVSCLRSPPTD